MQFLNVQSPWYQAAIYQDLRQLLPISAWQTWPDTEQMTALLPKPTCNSHGKSIQFVCQSTLDACPDGIYYEQRILESGAVPTRPAHWHDLFNALIWSLFPKAKSLINQQHCDDIAKYGQKKRTPRRNALTLFDECGVIIAVADDHLSQALKQHEWEALFWQQRDAWGKTIRPFVFGHASYESYLQPFIGLCGKALCLPVSADFFTLPLLKQYQALDQQLSLALSADLLADNRPLSPLPLLGVPGWWPENESREFYLNQDYFRPAPKRS
ncbi:DUF3025 domain-containing protein [Corallincola luteus]|uniref:DUF3025 domain-containing protein n=1 Tax=Corallincola luteus TaxID=1775177 RepID=A0ABY2ARB5_9GAMM|nr:DUF3025 domain-containing protein [Corallincola luteus]TCI05499.1 DUF3025 domain-containing protein [Corallincola luteus]